jgi:hypothetical protein
MAIPRKPLRNQGKTGQGSGNRNFSLVQQNDAQRALVAKMRNKLAGGSEIGFYMDQAKRRAVQKTAYGWGTKIGIAAIVILANLTYLGYREENGPKAAAKRAQTLPAPKANLSKEDQALYWAYALYDYDRLRSRFGVPATTVVNAGLALARLNELLPNVDVHTRSIIEGYMPAARRKP